MAALFYSGGMKCNKLSYKSLIPKSEILTFTHENYLIKL